MMNSYREKCAPCILYLANALVSSTDRAVGHWSLGLISSKGQGCHPNTTHTHAYTPRDLTHVHVCVCVILKVGINHLYCAEAVI